MSSFHDRGFVVLGATGGIGSHIATELGNRGARQLLVGRDQNKLDELSHNVDRCQTYALDARNLDEVQACFEYADEQLGTVDGAVNCVGSLLLKSAHRTTEEQWRQVLATNLDSAFATVRSAAHTMIQEGGAIVLVTMAAAQVGLSNHDGIAAAKAGIEGLARSAAATYAARNIRINCVAPGLVETSLSEALHAKKANRKASLALHPLQRFGKPRDIAAAVLFFLDPDNDWITGQRLAVDGGLSAIRG